MRLAPLMRGLPRAGHWLAAWHTFAFQLTGSESWCLSPINDEGSELQAVEGASQSHIAVEWQSRPKHRVSESDRRPDSMGSTLGGQKAERRLEWP